MTSPTHRSQQMVERRAKVAVLRLQGIRNQQKLAEMLGVTQATISNDFAALDKEYRQRAAQDIAAAKGLDLERIEEMIAGLWPQASTGGYLSVDRVVALMDRKAKLLGMDAPKAVDVTSAGRAIVPFADLYTLAQEAPADGSGSPHPTDSAADRQPGEA